MRTIRSIPLVITVFLSGLLHGQEGWTPGPSTWEYVAVLDTANFPQFCTVDGNDRITTPSVA